MHRICWHAFCLLHYIYEHLDIDDDDDCDESVAGDDVGGDFYRLGT